MYQNHNMNTVIYSHSIPMLDMEFDRFELNSDLEESLREADTATFYHDALEFEE